MSGYEIKPAGWLSFDIRELWQYRELFWFMAWRDIKVKYKQTFLGFIWVILQPLVLMLIFTTLWTRVMKPGVIDIPYPLFAYSGLIYWGLFSAGISGASESMISNSNMIKKVYFPRIIIPAACIIVALFDFIMTLALLMIMLIHYGNEVNVLRFSGLFLLGTLITSVSSFGIGLIIASATVQYRDFRYVIPFFLQAFFFISPVVYPLTLYSSESLRLFLSFNPLAGAIITGRAAFSSGPVDWTSTLWSAISALVILIAGISLFRRMESQYADML